MVNFFEKYTIHASFKANKYFFKNMSWGSLHSFHSGDHFEQRVFHDRILSFGNAPFKVLEEDIESWIDMETSDPSSAPALHVMHYVILLISLAAFIFAWSAFYCGHRLYGIATCNTRCEVRTVSVRFSSLFSFRRSLWAARVPRQDPVIWERAVQSSGGGHWVLDRHGDQRPLLRSSAPRDALRNSTHFSGGIHFCVKCVLLWT